MPHQVDCGKGEIMKQDGTVSVSSNGKVLPQGPRIKPHIVRSKPMTDRDESRSPTEEELRRKQAMLARTEGILHIGSWEWDPATDSTTWSDELFRIFQRDPAEGAPSFAEHSELYHPEDMRQLLEAVEEARSGGRPYEIRLPGK